MTRKIAIEDFRRQVEAASQTQRERTRDGAGKEAKGYRFRKEISADGCKAILNVARIASVIEGFPDTVPIASSDGYNEGLAIKREEGGPWRFAGPLDSLRKWSRGTVDGSMGHMASHALSAMGIPHGSVAHRQLMDLAKWPDPDDLEESLREIIRTVPTHVALASAGYAVDMAQAVAPPGNYTTFQRALPAWIKSVESLVGKDLADPLSEDAPSPVHLAAASGHVETLGAMYRLKVDIDRPLPGGHSHDGETPALYALRQGRFFEAQTLFRFGASATTISARGETTLIATALAVQAFDSCIDDAMDMFSFLRIKNVDPHHESNDGDTVASILEGKLSTLRSTGGPRSSINQIEDLVDLMTTTRPTPG